MVAKRLIAAVMTVATCAVTSSRAATVVFSEDFEGYADSTALRAAWTGSTATAFNLNNTGYDPSPTSLATQTGVTNLGRFVGGQSAYKAIPTPVAASTNFSAQGTCWPRPIHDHSASPSPMPPARRVTSCSGTTRR